MTRLVEIDPFGEKNVCVGGCIIAFEDDVCDRLLT